MFLDPIERHTEIANVYQYGAAIFTSRGIQRGLRWQLKQAMIANPIYAYLSTFTDTSQLNEEIYIRIGRQVIDDGKNRKWKQR